jgi:hypothetical protein
VHNQGKAKEDLSAELQGAIDAKMKVEMELLQLRNRQNDDIGKQQRETKKYKDQLEKLKIACDFQLKEERKQKETDMAEQSLKFQQQLGGVADGITC